MASCQNIGEIGQKQERKQKNRHQVSEPMRSKQTKVGENATGDNEAAWGNTKKTEEGSNREHIRQPPATIRHLARAESTKEQPQVK